MTVSRQGHFSEPCIPVTRKMRAAEVLLTQDCVQEGLSLATTAMLASVALRAGLEEPPERSEAAVWLYSDAVPRGIVCGEDAASITRAMALASAPSVPEGLVQEVLSDARRLAVTA